MYNLQHEVNLGLLRGKKDDTRQRLLPPTRLSQQPVSKISFKCLEVTFTVHLSCSNRMHTYIQEAENSLQHCHVSNTIQSNHAKYITEYFIFISIQYIYSLKNLHVQLMWIKNKNKKKQTNKLNNTNIFNVKPCVLLGSFSWVSVQAVDC